MPFSLLLLGPAISLAGTHEVILGTTHLLFAKNATQFGIAPGYQFEVLSFLQVGAIANLQSVSYEETSILTLSLMVGPTFNLGGPIEQAFFISSGLALRTGSAQTQGSSTSPPVTVPSEENPSPDGTGFYFVVGKRLPALPSVTLRPMVGVQGAGTMGFLIQPLVVSYHF